MRAGRLLSVLLILQGEGRVTARELARRMEVSERTILRDLAELGASGVPVYAVRGPQGGFELLDTWRQQVPSAPGLATAAGPGRLRRVRVRIAPSALQRVLVSGTPEGWRPRPFPDGSDTHPDWVEGSFRFTSEDEALRGLLALAPDVEVLLPLGLRAAMADAGRRIAEQHAAPGG